MGALGALIPALLLARVGWEAQLAAAVVVTGLSIWSSGRFADEGDPNWIVVDEAAGTFLATIGVSLWPALIGFAVFRVADITKAFPLVRRAERLPGGLGITADDIVAGLWGSGGGLGGAGGFWGKGPQAGRPKYHNQAAAAAIPA